jgi:aspartyl aminopeptidase
VTHELLKINRPVMRIPSLAIHLNREMNNGFAVNFQQHMAPIIADATESALGAGSVPKDEPDAKKLKESANPSLQKLGELMNASSDSTRHHPVLLELIADELRCDVGDVADFDLQLCDVQPSTIGGARNEYIFSGRLDNLASCYASLGKFLFILLVRAIRVLTSCFVSSHSGARQIYERFVFAERGDRREDAGTLRPRGGRQ